MGFVRRGGGGGGGDEGGGDVEGLQGDEFRRCATCRRELLPWQERCPDDGGAAVRPGEIEPDHDELLARLLAEDEPAQGDEGGDGAAAGSAGTPAP